MQLSTPMEKRRQRWIIQQIVWRTMHEKKEKKCKHEETQKDEHNWWLNADPTLDSKHRRRASRTLYETLERQDFNIDKVNECLDKTLTSSKKDWCKHRYLGSKKRAPEQHAAAVVGQPQSLQSLIRPCSMANCERHQRGGNPPAREQTATPAGIYGRHRQDANCLAPNSLSMVVTWWRSQGSRKSCEVFSSRSRGEREPSARQAGQI